MAETATPPHTWARSQPETYAPWKRWQKGRARRECAVLTISRSTNQLCCRFSMSGRGVHSLHLARLELASGWQMRCRCVHSERQALSAAETIHGRALCAAIDDGGGPVESHWVASPCLDRAAA